MGYDWRQSCAAHAAQLVATVDRILEVERAQQLIVVTHRMGGLVLRAALAGSSTLAARIRGVIHTVQPSVGAVVAARRFRTGFDRGIDGQLGEMLAGVVRESIGAGVAEDGVFPEDASEADFASTMLFQAIFSDRRLSASPEFYSRLMALLPGAIELLPSDRAGRSWWPHAQSRPHMSVWDLYAANWNQSGLIPDALTGTPSEAELRKRFSEAKHFHQSVEGRYHPVTGVLYSSGLTTDTELDPQRRPREGDGTVPAFSGSCPDLVAPYFVQRVARIEHAACFSSSGFRNAVLNGIVHLAGGGSALGQHPPPDRTAGRSTP